MMNKKIIKFTTGVMTALALMATSVGALAALPVEELVPMGSAVGISVRTQGAMVVTTSEVETERGVAAPAASAGMMPGDIIVQINQHKIASADELKDVMAEHSGGAVSVRVNRAEREKQLTVNPVINKNGYYEMGVLLRDSMTGIGTVTFYDPQSGSFAALGHAINDIDTGVLVPLREGEIMTATVTEVVRGKAGAPGQLHGVFSKAGEIGEIDCNTPQGIFGVMENSAIAGGRTAIPVAEECEICLGGAIILSDVDGQGTKEYKIEITRVYSDKEAEGRTVMISVTDETLIEKTGGIVQGMSGSPIIQNGKLIGAVTHVLINDPLRGYGISVEKMLKNIDFETFKAA